MSLYPKHFCTNQSRGGGRDGGGPGGPGGARAGGGPGRALDTGGGARDGGVVRDGDTVWDGGVVRGPLDGGFVRGTELETNGRCSVEAAGGGRE